QAIRVIPSSPAAAQTSPRPRERLRGSLGGRFPPLRYSHAMGSLLALLSICCFTITAQSWVPVTAGTTANLRGVSAMNNTPTAWISGDKGTVLKTADGGMTWRSVSPAGTADVDFRDIEVVDERTVFLMGAGEGPKSRIYKTT